MVSDRGGTTIVIAGTGVSFWPIYASQPTVGGGAASRFTTSVRPGGNGPATPGRVSFCADTGRNQAEAMGLGDPADTARALGGKREAHFRYLQIPDKNCFSDVNHWLKLNLDSGTPVIIGAPSGARGPAAVHRP